MKQFINNLKKKYNFKIIVYIILLIIALIIVLYFLYLQINSGNIFRENMDIYDILIVVAFLMFWIWNVHLTWKLKQIEKTL